MVPGGMAWNGLCALALVTVIGMRWIPHWRLGAEGNTLGVQLNPTSQYGMTALDTITISG